MSERITGAPPAAESTAPPDPGDTRTRILEATFRRLAQDGYAQLSVREIARDAGVNHALINYHYGSKDQLVIEVLDAANRRLLSRQASMYGGPGGFAEKWAAARRYYAADLASGFVRVQAELWAASLANPELREKFLPRLHAWKQLVRAGVQDALAAFERHGGRLPAPFSADVVACWISEFWLGMEFADLLEPQGSPQRAAALDAVESLLQSLDAQIAAAAAAPSTAPRRTRR